MHGNNIYEQRTLNILLKMTPFTSWRVTKPVCLINLLD